MEDGTGAQRNGGVRFEPTPLALHGLVIAAALAAIARLIGAAWAWSVGDVEPLTAYGFAVLFPLFLAWLLLSRGSVRTREGALMRLGTACHLVLVAATPRFSLHLLLGLPVVFLLVELFETRLPRALREPVATRLVSAC